MVSGMHAPGSPPIWALVQDSMAGRSLRYIEKIGRLRLKLPDERFAAIWPRRFHSQYPAGYQSC
jgi:hypothetical protein